MKTADTYEKLKALCLPHLEAFQTDLLVHDKRSIEDNPGVPFLHFTRAWGTHMVVLIDAKDYPGDGEVVPYLFGRATREHVLAQTVRIVEYMPKMDRQKCVCYFDGATLKTITQQQAEEIARRYVRKIRRAWRKS